MLIGIATGAAPRRQPAHPWLVAEDGDGGDRRPRGRGLLGMARSGRMQGDPAFPKTEEPPTVTTDALTEDGRGRVLADGNRIPLLGLGVWQVPSGRPCVDAVSWALELGYRHIDTAQAYGNEESVGIALRTSRVPRDQIFVTTKFFPGDRDPVAAIEQSLRRLQIDRVDLYIVHWPQGGATWAWPGMERAHERGYARSVGVSNFSATQLAEVIAAGTCRPRSTRCSSALSSYRRALLDACRDQRASPSRPTARWERAATSATRRSAGSPRPSGAPRPRSSCAGASSAGIPVIPKSTHRDRIEENADIFGFELSEQEMAELDALDRTGGTDRALEHRWW